MKYKWFLTLATVLLAVVSAQAETNIIARNEKAPSTTVPAEAIKVFTEDFSSGHFSNEWDIVQGIWSVTNGALAGIGKDAVIVSKHDFGENVRLEYTCWSDDPAPCDLSAALNSPGQGSWLESAFFFQFGGEYNARNVIRFNDNILAQTNCAASDGIVKGKKHRVIVQKDDQRVSQYIDGREVLEASLPPSGKIRAKGQKIAFYIWSTGCIDDVVVYALPSLPRKEPVAEKPAEVEATVRECLDFSTNAAGQKPAQMDVVENGGKVSVADEPTWIYGTNTELFVKNTRSSVGYADFANAAKVYGADTESFVKDPCVQMSSAKQAKGVTIRRLFAPLQSGVMEADIKIGNFGEGGISISLTDRNGKEAGSMGINKDGIWWIAGKDGVRAITDLIHFQNRGVGCPLIFQTNRWYTLRLVFDTESRKLSGGYNLFTPLDQYRKFWVNSTLVPTGTYVYCRSESTSTAEEIAGVSISVSNGMAARIDNLCVIGPVGAQTVAGVNYHLEPLRTVMKLDFPPRKDPLDMKVYTVRNLPEQLSLRLSYRQPSYLAAWGDDPLIYNSFNVYASTRYNDLLMKQAFLTERRQMLERAEAHLRSGGSLDAALSNRVAAAMQTERTTVELLGRLYTAFANAYLDNRNVSMLMTTFVPLAEKLEETIEDSSKIIEDCLNRLPGQALTGSAPVTPCPLPMEEKSDQIFTWKGGQFYRNGEPDFVVIYGEDNMYYHYPRKAQFNKIRRAQLLPYGVLRDWDSSKEPAEGKYLKDTSTDGMPGIYTDWRPGDPRRGPVVVLPCWNDCICVPKWWLDANRDDKDILEKTKDGRDVPVPDNSKVAVNIWNPKVREMRSKTFEQAALWYKTNTAGTLYYILGQEMLNFHYSGYNESARQEFRSFLEKEYQSINSLNTKWRTNYTSFAEINPPMSGRNSMGLHSELGLHCEFQRFRHEGLKQWMLLQRAALQKATPEVPTLIDFHNLLGGIPAWGNEESDSFFDVPSLFESCDIISFHIYDSDEHRFKYSNRWLDSLRKAYGNTLGNIEFAPNMNCPDFYDEDIYKNNMLQQTFHMMMWGQGIPYYWAFMGSGWSDGYSVCDQRYAMMLMRYMGSYAALAVDRIRRFGRIALQAGTVPPETAILEATSAWYLEVKGPPKVRPGMQAAALELESAGINYGFLYEKLVMEGRQNLKTVQALIVPNGFCMAEKLQDILIPWVKGGGILICYGAPGVVNSYGQPDGRLLGMAFPGTAWEKKPKEWVPADPNATLQSVACGTAKIYEGKIGKGKLVLFSSMDVDKDMRRKTLDIVKNNVHQSFWCRDNKFDLVLREKDKVKFMFILNSSLKETADDEILVKGRFEKITDKGLQRPMVIPAQYADGFTTFKIHLAPAEGTLVEMIP